MKNTGLSLPKISTIVLCTVSCLACSRLIEVPTPKNQLESNVVFSDSASAASAIASIYGYYATSIHNNSKFLALYVDDYSFTSSTPSTLEFAQSRVSPNNATNESLWDNLYFIIYQCNSVIEQANSSTLISNTLLTRLVNEARFLRAFAYFQLVSLFGNIPLILSTDVNSNAVAHQSEPHTVFEQIIEDLRNAKQHLSEIYITDGKVRANKWAASALLSRVYLSLEQWQLAEQEAAEIINLGGYNPLSTIELLFRANNNEVILELWNQNGFINDAAQLIPAAVTTIPTYTISEDLYQVFDDVDQRKQSWININTVTSGGNTTDYPYPYKYRNRTASTSQPEYLVVLRLSEQYLIRAESRAQQENIQAAVEDINVVRQRAGLPPLNSEITVQECLDAVSLERRLEFFGEWGVRFMDLKRAGQINSVMKSNKATWREDTSAVLPIPLSEITYNQNLTQNHGY